MDDHSNLPGKQVKDLKIEISEDGRKYSTKTVTYNLEMPLQSEREISEKSTLTSLTDEKPEPCVFPVLRWCFSIAALVVLIFVFIIIGIMFYEVITRSEPGR
jgi:hypothetical protein